MFFVIFCPVLFHLNSQNFEEKEKEMKSLCPSSSLPLPLLLFCLSFIMSAFPVSHANPQLYKNCRNAVFKCGDVHAGYPFFGGHRSLGCGHPRLELRCDLDTNITTIEIVGVKYQVMDIDRDRRSVRIWREDFIKNGFCSPQLPIRNSIMDPELFDLPPDVYTNVTLFYDCPSSSIESSLAHSPCYNHSTHMNISLFRDKRDGDGCLANLTHLWPRISWERFRKHPSPELAREEVFRGLEVKWKEDWEEACDKCNSSGGACGFGFDNQTICICPHPSQNWPLEYPKECRHLAIAPSLSHRVARNIELGIGLAGAAAILVGIGILLVWQQRRKKIAALVISRELPTSSSSKGLTTSTTNTSNSSYYTSKSDEIERGSTYFGAHVFNYEELEEATDHFNPAKHLGEGGFGTVYYGVLKDGRVVAVKRLLENNLRRVDQYMNEIEILTLIRHPNLVTLYGCTSRRSRELLLVYEYIPNGTLADHLHGKRSNSRSLTWNARLSIAIETVMALSYLHASDIIHRDVKSNNILLDNNFHVKVADFGLSRLFPTDVTHVSTAPQGTPGYVDPEYHQCYHLTEKSDVYSFGVVLIELISAKKAVDTNRHRHEINLANMAISRIKNQALPELVDPSLGFEHNYEVKNGVTLVAELAFQCLQQEREMRPSMREVLQTLREIKEVRMEAEVVDIGSDDVRLLLKNIPPPPSPDYGTEKRAQRRSI